MADVAPGDGPRGLAEYSLLLNVIRNKLNELTTPKIGSASNPEGATKRRSFQLQSRCFELCCVETAYRISSCFQEDDWLAVLNQLMSEKQANRSSAHYDCRVLGGSHVSYVRVEVVGSLASFRFNLTRSELKKSRLSTMPATRKLIPIPTS